jgi:hypothetical protein
MKNILLFLIGAFSCLQAFAQDPNPDLFQTWYLTNLSDELGDEIIVSNVSPSIHPTFTITELLDFSGIVCNEYGGFFTYDAVNDHLFLDEFSPCLCGTCNNPPPSHVTLEERYFEFFLTGGLYSYAITDGPQGDKILALDSQIFSTLIFSNTFLGVTDQKMNAVNVFPNPVSDELFITSEGMVIEKIIVYSMSGQTVLTSENIAGSIDVSSLSEGLYFIEVSSSEGKSVQKFVKN